MSSLEISRKSRRQPALLFLSQEKIGISGFRNLFAGFFFFLLVTEKERKRDF
jgi:hypothetical protein